MSNFHKRNPKRVAQFNQFLKTLDNLSLAPPNKTIVKEGGRLDPPIVEMLKRLGINVHAPNTKIVLYRQVIPKTHPEPTASSSTSTASSSTSTPEPSPTKQVTIEATIQCIDDLLALVDTYPNDPSVQYNINMKALHDIQAPLRELNHMVGMQPLKQSIVDQLVYFMQGLHKNEDNTGEFLHTVIYGPPGTGKTEVAKLMGKLYSQLGILSKGTFKKATRDDLVAGYLGQTAIKTREVIKEALGGVLFIDEAYSLGNPDKKDSFAKECIDVLCEALSEHKSDLMVIVAGYEKELKECFFSYNPGLSSRFNWRFQTDDYTPDDLCNIFRKKVTNIGWRLEAEAEAKLASWFLKHKASFPFYGRDVETLLSRTKIAHGRRVFGRSLDEQKVITLADLDKGFERYLNSDELKKKKEEEERNQYLYSTLYC